MDRERQAADYESALGADTRLRQQQLAKDFLPCCGEHKLDGHHEACSKRPVDEAPPVNPDQESLL